MLEFSLDESMADKRNETDVTPLVPMKLAL